MEQEIPNSYVVEKILEQEIIDKKPHYLIKWKGYSATESTWQPIENLLETLDLIHEWKAKNSSYSKRTQKAPEKTKIKKTKKINQVEKAHEQTDRKIQKKLNSTRKAHKQFIDDSIIIQEDQSTGLDQICTRSSKRLEQSSSPIAPQGQKRIQHLRNKQTSSLSVDLNQIEQRKQRKKKPKKSMNQYFSKFSESLHKNTKQTIQPQSDVQGFKVVGKITRDGIAKVLWCFDWEGQKICQVQLVNGNKANMRREDVQRICPDKLCEYLQKIIDYKH